MTSAALWTLISDKKIRRQAWETAVHLSDSPLVKSIQAGDTIGTVREGIKEIQRFVPSMQVVGKSVADHATVFSHFNAAAVATKIGMNLVLTYQGQQALQLIAEKLEGISQALAAQTALMAQKDFAAYVYAMIKERMGQTAGDPTASHWFFVYHPDNDWYPNFYQLLEKNALGPSFCGYTNQIDTVFLFMCAARKLAERRDRKERKKGHHPLPVKLHLIIPAYQPILIAEALRIPEEVGDLVIEGRIHNNKNMVWFNLPDEQRHYCDGIGQWVPPSPGFIKWAFGRLGLVSEGIKLGDRRVIGTSQDGTKKARIEEKDIADDEADEEPGKGVVGSEIVEVGSAVATTVSDRERERKSSRKQIEEAKKTAMPLHARVAAKEAAKEVAKENKKLSRRMSKRT